MVQHSNEHPTIAQLSAYVDKELASDEQAQCDAHLQSCARCRAELADLRLTSALLRKMPQVEAPRSFTLPLTMAVLPTTPDRESVRRLQPARSQYVLKRSLRALSTLAAVIGLIFILTGVFSSFPRISPTASTQRSNAALPVASASPIFGTRTPPEAHVTQQTVHATAQAATNGPRPTSAPTSPSVGSAQPPEPQFNLPSALDPGQPEGRLSIGAALLLLGILGFLLARRPQREAGH